MMLRNAPLPFPLDTAPDSWEADALYHDIMNDFLTRWKTAGYSWKFGHEINFELDLRDPEGYGEAIEEMADEAGHTSEDSDIQVILWEAYKLVADPKAAEELQNRIDAMRAFFKTPEAEIFARSVGRSLKDLKTEFAGYVRGLHSREYDIQVRARMSLCLAWMHMMPSSQGGLRDLIEPRFGDQHYGVGWWDAPPQRIGQQDGIEDTLSGDVEMRLPVQDAHSLIDNYHRALPIIVQTAGYFGLRVQFPQDTHTQLHASLWHDASGRNISRMDNDADLATWQSALGGYMHLLHAGSGLVRSHRGLTLEYDQEFGLGNSRIHHIRQKPENIELRGFTYTSHLHAARHIAMLMAGTWHGHEKPELSQTPKTVTPDDVTVYQNPFTRRFVSKVAGRVVEMAVNEHPIVEHRHDLTHSAFVAVLEQSEIAPDGKLHANPYIVRINLERLTQEAGEELCFEARSPSKQPGEDGQDFHYASSWQALFDQTYVTSDNKLVFPDWAHAEIVSAFDDVTITGRRNIVSGSTQPRENGLNALIATPHAFEKGILSAIFTREQARELKAFHTKYAQDRVSDVARELLKDGYTALALWTEDGKPDMDRVLNRFMKSIFLPSMRVMYDTLAQTSHIDELPPVTRQELAAIETPVKSISRAFVLHAKGDDSLKDAPADAVQRLGWTFAGFTRHPEDVLRAMLRSLVENYTQRVNPEEELREHVIGWQLTQAMMAADLDMPLDSIRAHIGKTDGMLRAAIEAQRVHPRMALDPEEFNLYAVRMMQTHQRMNTAFLETLDLFAHGKPAPVCQAPAKFMHP